MQIFLTRLSSGSIITLDVEGTDTYVNIIMKLFRIFVYCKREKKKKRKKYMI